MTFKYGIVVSTFLDTPIPNPGPEYPLELRLHSLEHFSLGAFSYMKFSVTAALINK